MTLQAQDALAQAQKQRPAATLAIATLPLGKAFALSEGWAEAKGVTAFRVQAHTRMVQAPRCVESKACVAGQRGSSG